MPQLVDRYGDPLPPGAIARLGTVRLRHGFTAPCVAFACRGDKVVSCSWDETVSVWDAASGRELSRLSGHSGEVFRVATSPVDNDLAASVGIDGTMRLWDLRGKRQVFLLETGRPLNDVAFLPDGQRVVCGDEAGELHLFDIAAQETVLRWLAHEGGVTVITVSPRGLIASGGRDQQITVWSLDTGGRITAFAHATRPASALAFSSDGALLAAAFGIPGMEDRDATWAKLHVWGVPSGQLIATSYDQTVYIAALGFAPNRAALAVGVEDEIHIVDVPRMIVRQRLFLGDTAWSVAFSPNGDRLAVSVQGSALSVWDLSAGARLLDDSGHNSFVTCAQYSPCGRVIATGSFDGSLRTWHAETGDPVWSIGWRRALVKATAFSNDGALLAASVWTCGENGRGVVHLFDPAHHSLIGQLGRDGETIHRAVWSPNGRLMATSSADKTYSVWDVDARQRCWTYHPPDDEFPPAVTSLAFSSDGSLLAAANENGEVRVWAPVSGKLVCVLRTETVETKLAFHPQGRWIACVGRGRTEGVYVWEIGRRRLSRTLRVPPNRFPVSLAFSPVGELLVGGCGNGDLVLWSAATWMLAGELPAHRGCVECVSFSPDGQRFVSVSSDTTGMIWSRERLPLSVKGA